MNNYIYLTIIFFSVFVIVGCQKKSIEQKTESVNTVEKQITKDSIISNSNPNSNSEVYSGVYEGKISVNTGSTGYELLDGWIAFDFTGKNSIVLYDGVFRDDFKLVNDSVKGLGKFGENHKQKGFYLDYEKDDFTTEYIKPIFLRKTGNIVAAREKIKIYTNEKILFENFYTNFKQELLSKDFKKLAGYGNFPLMDYSNNSKISNRIQLENKLRSVFDESFFKDHYNIESLNETPIRFEDHSPENKGEYIIQTGVLFFNFKKIGDSIKIISISHPYG